MFIKPAEGRITSRFRDSRKDHHGVDISKSGVVTIKAAAAGTVTRSYRSTSYGECVMIVHNINGQTWETVYAHMRTGSRRVKVGDHVKQGQAIGLMGNTGRSTGQHLHFEIHKGRWNITKSNAVDPLQYIGKGAEVRELQTKLRDLGYDSGEIDGIMGDKTERSVREFQKDAGLTVDGLAGKQTWAALNASFQTLRTGSKGPAVRSLQMRLKRAGYNPGPIDGKYGPKTAQAVKEVQKRSNIAIDGITGSQTRNALKKALSNRKYPGYVFKLKKPYMNDKNLGGKDIESIQRVVGAKPDGIYGPETKNKVIAYQKAHGLEPDGIVGPKTWNRMF